ncbi:hypothetical protein HDU77_011005 [Chytriomyces hyalinus]|nr:hypothetical protein HDU77_011005 [Chytriomyces hyalinus]
MSMAPPMEVIERQALKNLQQEEERALMAECINNNDSKDYAGEEDDGNEFDFDSNEFDKEYNHQEDKVEADPDNENTKKDKAATTSSVLSKNYLAVLASCHNQRRSPILMLSATLL